MPFVYRDPWLAAAAEYFKPDDELCEREVLAVEMRQRTQAAHGG